MSLDGPAIVPLRTRDPLEIQRAHDLLHAVLGGELPVVMPEGVRLVVTAQLDVLCWALNHDHNTSFAENLHELREEIRAAGYEERKAPFPFTRGQMGARD